LEVSYRPIELRSLIDRAYQERSSITVANVACPLPSKWAAKELKRPIDLKLVALDPADRIHKLWH
jgi:hypothetical protein